MSSDVSRLLFRKGYKVRYRRVQTDNNDAWSRLLKGDGSLLKPYKMGGSSASTVVAVLVVVLVMSVGGAYCYQLYLRQKGIRQAQGQEQEKIIAQNVAIELRGLRQEAEEMVSHQEKDALNDPSTLDNLSNLVHSKTATAEDLKAGIKVVKDSRKPASDGESYDEWVKKADDFVRKVKANNNSKEAASIVSMYPTVKNSGNAEELKEFVEENQKLL